METRIEMINQYIDILKLLIPMLKKDNLEKRHTCEQTPVDHSLDGGHLTKVLSPVLIRISLCACLIKHS